MRWVTSLAGRVQPKTIKAYLAAVKSLHGDLGLPDPTAVCPRLQRLIRGIARYHGTAESRPRLPITRDILTRIATTNSTTIFDDVNFMAASCLAFFGFLRSGEITWDIFDPAYNISQSSIQFLPDDQNPTHASLAIPSSKTDPFRTGVTIYIAAIPGSPICPILWLRRLFTLRPRKTGYTPLFSRSDNGAFSRSFLVNRLRSALLRIGILPDNYAGHSFRIGAATAAAEKGFTQYEIQVLGRWRSDAYLTYIRLPIQRILDLSTAMAHSARFGPVF
jgi:hypothetical protein